MKKNLRQIGYIIFHPFDGFWSLKHENPVSYLNAWVILLILVVVYTIRSQFTGFIINLSDKTDFNLFYQATSIILPFLLWCISNWCITTLVDGEGSFKDIFITTAYALIPLILLNIPMVIISNLITVDEVVFYNILDTVSILWAGFLLVIGIMTIHQFSMKKTLFTILIAVLGMIIIVFLFLLFFTLIQNIINFIRLLWAEITIRMYS